MDPKEREASDFDDEDTLELDPSEEEDDGVETTWEWDGSGWRKVE